mmetsp:Transcript_43744/g.76746  ORF Transcript_43744/g.76746 Transcript_43744/m.76746 type:complete len:443 (+) Transcript_43744:56-1384(+)
MPRLKRDLLTELHRSFATSWHIMRNILLLLIPAILGTLADDLTSPNIESCEAKSPLVMGERSLLQKATQRFPKARLHATEVGHKFRHRYNRSNSGRRSLARPPRFEPEVDQGERLEQIQWRTNIGQEHHACYGSKFDVDVSGSYGGLVLKEGMLLRKGKCQHSKKNSKPLYTQLLSCEDEATGCHMWCAPVWISHHDSTNWAAYDERCKTWNGSFDDSDSACQKADKLFTWARTEVPTGKNALDMTFAITKDCDRWCSPLWVTVYDEDDFAKSWRWCFNRKDDWGSCDTQQDISLGKWHELSFQMDQFVQKHGYHPDSLILELAIYAEFDATPEVIVSHLKFNEESQVATTTKAPPIEMKGEFDRHKGKIQNCGQRPCGKDQKCCRKGGNSTLVTKCCPTDWQCCEDSCCPSYYTCTVTDEKHHSCDAPAEEPPKKPELCML